MTETTPAGSSDPPRPGLPRGDRGRLLLVGARRRVRVLARCLERGPFSGVPVVGFVDLSGRGRQLVVHPKSDPVPILGSVENLAELVDRSRATDVVVALSGLPARRLKPAITDLGAPPGDVRVHWVEDVLAPERRAWNPRPIPCGPSIAGRCRSAPPWPPSGPWTSSARWSAWRCWPLCSWSSP